MSDQNYKMVAATMSGLEEVQRELRELSAQHINILTRVLNLLEIRFMYKSNLNLRTTLEF